MFEGLFQPTHLILILVIALIVMGPGKLPDVARGLGKSIRDFKKATSEIRQEISEPMNEVKQPFVEMKQQVESIKRLPSDSLAGVTSASNGTATSAVAAEGVATIHGAVATNACPVCSSSNPAGNLFCGGCGAKLA